MDALLDPAFMLDEACHLLAANTPGRALIQRADILLVEAGDAFRFVGRADQHKLVKAVHQLCRAQAGHAGGDFPVGPAGAGHQVSLFAIAPNAETSLLTGRPSLSPPGGFALMVLRKATRPALDEHIVMPVGLTPAERRFVTELCGGGTIPQVAGRLGISYETARSRLKNIYAKTNVRSQRELITQLLGRR